jgi:hypothetical protein
VNVAEFVAKWRKVELKERSAAQEHFLDLCHVLGHPTPAEADPTGETFCFERGAAKHGGGDGFADVWKKDFFGWEYKGRLKDLGAALDQLLKYRNALENPPLLVVCDLDRIIVHTNFTRTASAVFEIPLEALGEPRNLEILRAVFFDPEKLKPGRTSAAMTEEAAERLAGIAESMRKRGLDPSAVAHFLNRLVFCLFAEDIGLLPGMIFTRIVEKSGGDPARFGKLLGQLFGAMAHGGDFGLDTIRHFNGNLFEDAAVVDMTAAEMKAVFGAAELDWGAIDPSIFGTLFERGLDPAKRSQLGAHYTGREDIETLVDAVVMAPLRREWAETRTTVENVLATGRKGPGPAPAVPLTGGALKKARGEADSILHGFLVRLQGVRVLDPACGSGNFLYVTLQRLKDLEKEAIVFAMDRGLGGYLPMVGPWQLFGLELNPYAHDLAQTSVWIGFLQWTRANGFQMTQDPILRPLKGNFRCMDSILDLSAPAAPKEPEWPTVDFIVGNPPFLGDKLMRRELGDEYVDRLRALYADRIPGQSDLCCYWFEKARAHIEAGKCRRAGLLATQGIRGGANREVLKRIMCSGGVFWAVSDRNWIQDGAAVHVSMVAFDGGEDKVRTLDGKPVPTINVNLTAAADLAAARPLLANRSRCFLGIMKAGPFDIAESLALEWLNTPNPNGRPSSDVLRPRMNAMDILRRTGGGWIVDFGCDADAAESALYERPYCHVLNVVKPLRDANRRNSLKVYWWLHGEPRPGLRNATRGLPRIILTPEVSKHRVFVWLESVYLPDHQTRVFAFFEDQFFGVLHSRLHELWALAQGTQLREKESGFRYTPTTCFETFPFPETTDAQRDAIGAAAAELNMLRERWLNPPEWTREEVLTFPGTVGGPWDRFIDPATAEDRGGFKVGVVRYPRTVPKDADCAAKLAKRTLTNLYNERPAWLANAHAALDAAVFAAYGWPADLPDAAILERLLALNLARAGEEEGRGGG